MVVVVYYNLFTDRSDKRSGFGIHGTVHLGKGGCRSSDVRNGYRIIRNREMEISLCFIFIAADTPYIGVRWTVGQNRQDSRFSGKDNRIAYDFHRVNI